MLSGMSFTALCDVFGNPLVSQPEPIGVLNVGRQPGLNSKCAGADTNTRVENAAGTALRGNFEPSGGPCDWIVNVDGFSNLDIVPGAILVGGGLGSPPTTRAGEFVVGTHVLARIPNPR